MVSGNDSGPPMVWASGRQVRPPELTRTDHVDRIEIRGLRVVGIVGALSEERDRAQPFEVDVDILTDISDAGATDNLDATINYADPVQMIENIIRNEAHVLLERVATRIAEDILAHPKVLAVEVVVRKLRPPLPADMTSTAVRIIRNRAQLSLERRPRTRAYVALGSNLGDRRASLRFAVENLPDVVAVSHVYETEPVGGPEGQGAYLNMVVGLDTDLDPFALLSRCRALEAEAGRVRSVRNAPRTLDADVLLHGDVRIESEELTIPHPRMWERRFVMAPLADIAADVVAPDWDQRLADGGVWRVDDLDMA